MQRQLSVEMLKRLDTTESMDDDRSSVCSFVPSSSTKSSIREEVSRLNIQTFPLETYAGADNHLQQQENRAVADDEPEQSQVSANVPEQTQVSSEDVTGESQLVLDVPEQSQEVPEQQLANEVPEPSPVPADVPEQSVVPDDVPEQSQLVDDIPEQRQDGEGKFKTQDRVSI